jgi:hypothetical protein
MEVQRRGASHDQPPTTFIACDRREDIGRVPIPLDSLRQVSFSLSGLAQMLVDTLQTDRMPQEVVLGRLWFLGKWQNKQSQCAVFLARDANQASNSLWENAHIQQYSMPLIFTLTSTAASKNSTAIAIGSAIACKNGSFLLDHIQLRQAITKPKPHLESGLTVRFDPHENHVLINDRVLARTRYESENSKVIAYLCRNPNRTIDLTELEAACGSLSKNIHQVLHQLGFKGKRKSIFFAANKGKLHFHNPVDHTRLAVLSIKKAEILAELKPL